MSESQGTAARTVCYRHPDRPAGVRCQRCERFICPSCMSTAAVGFHCPECAKSSKQKVYTASSIWHRRPIVTQAMIAINVAVFVVAIALGDNLSGRGRGSNGLLDDIGVFGPFVAELNEWYRIVTAGFGHFGILHLGLNMYALFALGPTLERSLGWRRFLLLYMVALLGGSFGALLAEPTALTAGASGAVFGLMGGLLAGQRSLGIDVWRSGLGPTLLLNLVISFGFPGISVGGHLGGLAAGYVCGWVNYELTRRKRLPKFGVEAIFVAVGVLCFVGAYVAAGTWDNPIF
jgi:membrane associated rhomboid family serine protease